MIMDTVLAKPKTFTLPRVPAIALWTVALVILSAFFYFWLPVQFNYGDPVYMGTDWETAFRPGALQLLSGQSPYDGLGLFNPPWIFAAIVPLAILPKAIGLSILTTANLFAFAFVTRRLGGDALTIAIVLLSPPVLTNAISGAVDGIFSLGFILPPPIALFFLLAKPQLGLPFALYLGWRTWRERGTKAVLYTFAPVSAAFLLSFAIYGLYPLRWIESMNAQHNESLWPISIPLGVFLLVAALLKKRANYTISAAPLLSPYAASYSWSALFLGLVQHRMLMLICFAFFWLSYLFANRVGHINLILFGGWH